MAKSSNSNRVCAVAGGTGGIGRAVALRFHAGGDRVSVAGRNALRLQELQQQMSERFLPLQLDLANDGQGDRFISQTVNQLGRLDVLVFCAAAAPLAPIENLSDQEFESVVDLNIRAMFYTIQSAWKQMRQLGGGTIVLLSSIAAVDPFPGFAVYGASKAWCDLLAQALAEEGRPHGIRLYSIRPGAVETPLLRGCFPDFPADQTLAPTDVAELIWSVCQPSFRFSSGQAIQIRQ